MKLPAPVDSQIRSWNIGPAGVLVFFYFAGCTILLVRLVDSLWLARLMKQTAVPVTSPAWTSGLEAWRLQLSVTRRVELLEGP
jgi:hypothetical protein